MLASLILLISRLNITPRNFMREPGLMAMCWNSNWYVCTEKNWQVCNQEDYVLLYHLWIVSHVYSCIKIYVSKLRMTHKHLHLLCMLLNIHISRRRQYTDIFLQCCIKLCFENLWKGVIFYWNVLVLFKDVACTRYLHRRRQVSCCCSCCRSPTEVDKSPGWPHVLWST